MPMILVCGEALIDLFVQSNYGLGSALKVSVGGSSLNVATGLSRLGIAVGFLGGVSTDHFGRLLTTFIRKEGIDTSLIKRSAQPTPLVLVAPDAQGQPSYTFYATESADRDVTLADVPTTLPEEIIAIALGSYTLAAEPFGSSLLVLAEREADRLVISLDCNLRPAVVGPLDVWRERIERFARCATIVKLSEEDLLTGWGAEADIEGLIGRWLAHRTKLVVVTRGTHGATAWHRSGRFSLPGRPVRVIDAVGAGDSFHAGLLTRLTAMGLLTHSSLALADQTELEDAMRYANVAASLTCGRRGADMPIGADIDAVIAEGAGGAFDES